VLWRGVSPKNLLRKVRGYGIGSSTLTLTKEIDMVINVEGGTCEQTNPEPYYWEDLDDSAKIERCRSQIKEMQDSITRLLDKLIELEEHEHFSDGTAGVPVNRPRYSRAMVPEPNADGKVYF
jgi:hypothetical protein